MVYIHNIVGVNHMAGLRTKFFQNALCSHMLNFVEDPCKTGHAW